MADELLLTTPVNDVYRRDIDVDSALLDPTESDCLLQGEWLVRNSAYAGVRPTTSVAGCYQVFNPKGDMTGQAIGKTAVLQLHEYEADTTIFSSVISVLQGGALTVKSVDIGDGVTRAGLIECGVGEFVYGYVTRLPANNNGKLRFQRCAPHIL